MNYKSFFLNILLGIVFSVYGPSELISAPAQAAHFSATETKFPTTRFLEFHSLASIKNVLMKYQATAKDQKLFDLLVSQENANFIGYHASSSDFRIFQDSIKFAIEELLEIPIREDFHFFRNPFDENLIYETAEQFIQALPIPLVGHDDQPSIRQHILSLNISLYQSYDKPWDLSPRYYLQNQTWTKPIYNALLEDFFSELGVSAKSVSTLYQKARVKLPTRRGIIYQFFMPDADYAAINTYFYVAYSGGQPYSFLFPSDALLNINDSFPQLRLVLNAKSSLNPFYKISMQRYDDLTHKERNTYEKFLREEIKKLPIHPEKLLKAKEKLFAGWTSLVNS